MREEIEKSALGPAELTAETGQRSFRFGDDFIGFSGHFPDYPILPAVLQTLMAQTVAEQLIGKPLQFLTLERAKFTHQLRPDDQIDVKLNYREKQGQLLFSCELQVDMNRAASFTLILAKELE
jgi:3-hydroxyacyl-[acyl-carrier-protein] dehydratase